MADIGISKDLDKILEQYGRKADEAVEKAAKRAGRDTAKTLRNTSPKKTGAYASSWSTKVTRSSGRLIGVTVYNKDHYQLTHLLENGHVIKNKKGEYGRTRPIKHIEPAEQEGIQNFEELVRAELESIT